MLTILIGAAIGAVFLALLLAPPEIRRDTVERRPPDFMVEDDAGNIARVFITRPKPEE